MEFVVVVLPVVVSTVACLVLCLYHSKVKGDLVLSNMSCDIPYRRHVKCHVIYIILWSSTALSPLTPYTNHLLKVIAKFSLPTRFIKYLEVDLGKCVPCCASDVNANIL